MAKYISFLRSFKTRFLFSFTKACSFLFFLDLSVMTADLHRIKFLSWGFLCLSLFHYLEPNCMRMRLVFLPTIERSGGALLWQAGLVTTAQMKARTTTLAALEGLTLRRQTRKNCTTASERSRTPSAVKSRNCRKNWHKKLWLHVVSLKLAFFFLST